MLHYEERGHPEDEKRNHKRPHAAGSVRSASGIASILALTLVAAAFIPMFPALEVREWKSGRLLYLTPMRVGGKFEVNFVHSVEKTPVREVFRAERDLSIYLVETIYESFGAGLPTTPDEGAKLVVGGGKTRITGMNRRIGNLFLAVSPFPGHTLATGEETIVLADLARPGTGLGIKVVREPAVIRFFRGRCKWTRTRK